MTITDVARELVKDRTKEFNRPGDYSDWYLTLNDHGGLRERHKDCGTLHRPHFELDDFLATDWQEVRKVIE